MTEPIDPTLLAIYSALAENVYRRDSENDQPLSIDEIGALVPGGIEVVNPAATPVDVTAQDGHLLGNLLAHGDYYYSERGFVGMIVQVDGKYVVVFRGTDTTLSGWSSVRAAVARDDTDSYTPNIIARPGRLAGTGDCLIAVYADHATPGRRHVATPPTPSYI